MKAIAELIQYVHRFGGALTGYGPKADRLIKGIASGELRTETEAEKALYKNRGTGTYRSFKRKVKHRLMRQAATLDDKEKTPQRKAISKSYMMLRLARMLLSAGARQAAKEVARKAEATAKRYGITGVIIETTELQRYLYFVERDKKRYTVTNTELAYWRRVQAAEQESWKVYEIAILEHDTEPGAALAKLQAAQKRIQRAAERYQTKELQECASATEKAIAKMTGDSVKLLASIEAEIQYYEKHPEHTTKSRKAQLHYELAITHQLANEPEKGVAEARKAMQETQKGRNNWLTAAGRATRCALAAGTGDTAQEIITQVKPYQRGLDVVTREQWALYEAATRILQPETAQPENTTLLPGARKWSIERFAQNTQRGCDQEQARRVLTAARRLQEAARGEAQAMDEWNRAVESLHRHYGERLQRTRVNYRIRCLIKFYTACRNAGYEMEQCRQAANEWKERLTTAEHRQIEAEILPYEIQIEQAIAAIEQINKKGIVVIPHPHKRKKAA